MNTSHRREEITSSRCFVPRGVVNSQAGYNGAEQTESGSELEITVFEGRHMIGHLLGSDKKTLQFGVVARLRHGRHLVISKQRSTNKHTESL
jgi:hypothetical protein